MISEVEKVSMGDILADVHASKWNWYTCHLLRLIAKADGVNRRLLKAIYPDEVMAYERWYMEDFKERRNKLYEPK